jgi:hypothetical protein
MHKVTLQFKSEAALRRFYEICKLKEAEINLRTLTILCHCDEREIDLALNAFDAVVLRREELNK